MYLIEVVKAENSSYHEIYRGAYIQINTYFRHHIYIFTNFPALSVGCSCGLKNSLEVGWQVWSRTKLDLVRMKAGHACICWNRAIAGFKFTSLLITNYLFL